MIPIDVLRAMYAAGAPVEAIFAAIEADQKKESADIDARLAHRREKNRGYQQEHRKRMSAHVSADHADKHLQALTSADNDCKENQQLNGHDQLFIDSSLTSLDSKEKKERKSRSQNRGQRLPDDWQPNAGHTAAGLKLGFTETQIQEQAQDMRIWAQTNGHRSVARKSDWDMTFLGWLRRTARQPRRFAPMERQLPR